MGIDYDHKKNSHTVESPRAALRILFSERKPASLLDVGCGTGGWLKAAQEAGVTLIMGVDGIQVSPNDFLVSPQAFQEQNLTGPFDLGKKFDAALCLEVAEHLDAQHARTLIGSLTRHSDWILFSAACPGQPGQHHVNCQWPAYWQSLFNAEGFACDDSLRWKLWNAQEVEPWYRQNIFAAQRDPARAGQEKRIEAVIHPDMLKLMNDEASHLWTDEIAKGALPASWYASAAGTALAAKLRRKLAG